MWTATDDSTIARPGTPSTDNTQTLNTMMLLPAQIKTPLEFTITPSKRSSMPRRGSSGRALSRRGYAQGGLAPRCTAFPRDAVYAVTNGIVTSPPNGCRPDGAWYSALVPNLSFGDCCNARVARRLQLQLSLAHAQLLWQHFFRIVRQMASAGLPRCCRPLQRRSIRIDVPELLPGRQQA